MRRASLLLVAMAVSDVARAAEWHVPLEGTLQDVVAGAGEWDTIYVDAGLYVPEGAVRVDQHIQITSLDGTPVEYPPFLVLDATLRLSGGVLGAGPIVGESAEGHVADAVAGVFVIDGTFQGHDLVIHGDGGLAIQGIDSEIDLDACELTGATSGAALRSYALNGDVLLYLTTTSVYDNATSGVWVQDLPPDDNYNVVDIASSTFSGNLSEEYGGDLRFYGVDRALVRDSTLQGGSAPQGGGSIALFDSSLSMSDTGIHGATAAHGGAIYAYGLDRTPTLELSGVELVDTEAADGSGFGGALFAEGVDVTLTEVAGSGVSAGYGGFAALAGGTLQAVGVTVVDATASVGGAWYISGAETASIADTTICATAADRGGAVFAETTTLTMERCVVQSVDAPAGAAVELSAGTLYLLDDTFVAATGPGAVFVDTGVTEVVNTLFSGAQTGVLLTDTTVPRAGYNLYWDLVVPDQDYMGYGESLYVDPRFDASFDPFDCSTRPWLASDSPALDAGDPSVLDDDDSPSDIGALPVWSDADADGDGAADDADCAPDDPAIHPGASDDPFDTVDQDCDGDAASGTARGGCGCGSPTAAGAWIACLSAMGAAGRRRRQVA